MCDPFICEVDLCIHVSDNVDFLLFQGFVVGQIACKCLKRTVVCITYYSAGYDIGRNQTQVNRLNV